MTAVPTPHLFTVAEYIELGEIESGYTELQEGRLLMSPSPTLKHNIASGRLFLQLTSQLPGDLEVIQDVDIDLDLPVSLTACHLAGDFGYQDASAVTGEFATSEPVPVKLRVDQLR